ncbi:MAG: hypothetical protein G01um101466_654 [Parcubacteria group bacterium Gr01-1014_66]|nr:MAG: hypothetical protein G01um101466_654 [Parcubacteria group bacterium Gr01-1014_66]
MKEIFIAIILGIAFGIAGLTAFFLFQCEDDWCFVFQWQKIRAANSFERCAELGFPVTQSHPRQCNAGRKSFQDIRGLLDIL